MSDELVQSTRLYHPAFEPLVDLFVARTNNPSKHFFRTQIAFYVGLVAASMRVHVTGWSGTKIPVNVYAVNLAPSGAGKGYSLGVLEKEVLAAFQESFSENTFRLSSMQHLQKLASKRAAKFGTDDADELHKLEKEFEGLGAYLLTFDSATVAAIKQLRHKVQLADAGSINFVMDEIGANLVGQNEVLNLFLELYDMGSTKEKLIKSTVENIRTERLTTLTPANMLLFGEPTSLLNGAATQAKFFEMLKMGYARRCIFGYIEQIEKRLDMSPEDMLDLLQSNSSNKIIQDLGDHFTNLAHFSNLNCSININRQQSLRLMSYKLDCEKLAATYPDHEGIRKAETEHRYFKVLKLAAAYAFFDGAPEIMADHLEYAINLVEDSGSHFKELINPPKPYIKLAKFLAQSHPNELTLADLDHDLPYFPTSKTGRDEMFAMASAWGYKNCHVLKRTIVNGITFFSGQALKPTSLDELIISYSADMTLGYKNMLSSFDILPQLFAMKEKRHWLNHHVSDGHRLGENVINGFNVLVFDVDGGCTLKTAASIFKQYSYIMYTTKRHQPDVEERFRIVLPINYLLHISENDYREIVKAIYQDLPLITFDESCAHRVKKWETNPNQSQIFVNKGELFDVLPYIPNTSKAEERQRSYAENPNMDALERWVLNNTEEGNRNNTLFKYGMILLDLNKDWDEIVTSIKSLNSKLTVPLDEIELDRTVINSITRKLITNRKQV